MTTSSGSSPSEPSPSDAGSSPEVDSEETSGDEPGFESNWAYLKTELKWLERLLLRAVARHRQTQKRVERCANSAADRVTQHWWKGLIVLDQPAGRDSYHKPPADPAPKLTYSQRLVRRIQSSSQAETVLGVPSLCDRLQLTPFEKAVVLTSLAPEVNRRYGQLYRYLQREGASGASASDSSSSDLPTVDLVLRLFCSNDVAWRAARERLVQPSPLIQSGLLYLVPVSQDEPFLNQRLKLAAPLVNYLLADRPDPRILDQLLAVPPIATVAPLTPSSVPGSQSFENRALLNASRSLDGVEQSASFHSYLIEQAPRATWSDLILPATVCSSLQQLVIDEPSLSTAVQDPVSRSETDSNPQFPGRIILLVGEPGTGKTLAANVLATALQTSLTQADLAVIQPEDYAQLWSEIDRLSPPVLLLKSAQCILGRTALINPTHLRQWLQHRRQQASTTVLSARWLQTIRPSWQQECDAVIQLPRPNQAARLKLWQQAFAAGHPQGDPLELPSSLNLETLAKRFKLTGSEILAIAQAARQQAQLEGCPITLRHIQLALAHQRR